MQTNTITVACLLFAGILLGSCQATLYEETSLNMEKESEEMATKSISVKSYNVSKEEADYMVSIYRPDRKIVSATALPNERKALMYLYKFDRGWLALSADKRISPIMAYNSEETTQSSGPSKIWLDAALYQIGKIQENQLCENENTQSWEFALRNMSLPTKEYPETKSGSATPKWALFFIGSMSNSSSEITIPHMIETQWGIQESYDPDSPLLCTFPHSERDGTPIKPFIRGKAIAIGQLFYYFHRKSGTPSKLYHTVGWRHNPVDTTRSMGKMFCVLSGNEQSNSTRWEQMPLSISDIPNRPDTNYVSDFLLDISGVVDWTYGGDSRYYYPLQEIFSRYGLSCQIGNYNSLTVTQNLFAEKPVIVSAYYGQTPGGTNHSWIIDGMVTDRTCIEHHYYVNYTQYLNGAYMVFDSEAEMRAYVGQDYRLGTEWIQYSDCTETRYSLMNWGLGIEDNSRYQLYSSIDWVPPIEEASEAFQHGIKINYNIQ